MKTKIILDGSINYNKEELRKYDFDVIPLKIIIGNEIYDSTTPKMDEILKLGLEEKKKCSTSQPSQENAREIINKYKKYDLVVVVTVSSTLSKTYDNLVSLTSEYPNLLVIDSKGGDYHNWNIAKRIYEKLDKIKNRDDVLAIVKKEIDFIDGKIILLADDLTQLVKSGRINSSLAIFAKLLQIKPIIVINNGILKKLAKVRSMTRAITKALEHLTKFSSDIKEIIVAEFFTKKEYLDFINTETVRLFGMKAKISKLSPVIATHLGLGSFGFIAIRK